MNASRVPQLYLVGARSLFDRDAAWLDALERVAAAVVSVPIRVALQVRIEDAPDPTALAAHACTRVRRVAAALPLFLNAAADAAALGYDGEHWPERRIPTLSGAAHRSAASVHSAAALQRAVAAGAEFAVFGAVWVPAWKAVPARGLGALQSLLTSATIPVVAIGGVTPGRVGDCLRAGAHGVAVASGLFAAADVAAAVAAYVTALQHAGCDEERRGGG